MNMKDKILEKALALFLENGYDGTSIAMIAKAVGTGKSSLYNYFENKQDLFNQVFLRCKEDFSQYQTDGVEEESMLKAFQFSIAHENELKFMIQFEDSPYITDESRKRGEQLNLLLNETYQKMCKENPGFDIPFTTLCKIFANITLDTIDYIVEDGKINMKHFTNVKRIIRSIIALDDK